MFNANNYLASKFGMWEYNYPEINTFGKIYEIAGRNDNVVTISFKRDTESYRLYKDDLTCMFQYTQKERRLPIQRMGKSIWIPYTHAFLTKLFR
jgi:hypothetical protein